jgi:hypothetical protein
VNVTVPVGVTGEPVTVAVSVADVPLTDGTVDRLTVQAVTVNDPVPLAEE